MQISPASNDLGLLPRASSLADAQQSILKNESIKTTSYLQPRADEPRHNIHTLSTKIEERKRVFSEPLVLNNAEVIPRRTFLKTPISREPSNNVSKITISLNSGPDSLLQRDFYSRRTTDNQIHSLGTSVSPRSDKSVLKSYKKQGVHIIVDVFKQKLFESFMTIWNYAQEQKNQRLRSQARDLSEVL